MKYIKKSFDDDSDGDDNHIHPQSVKRSEIKQMFLNRVPQIIFEVKEPRSLHRLLMDYIELLDNFGYNESQTKTRTIKEMIKHEPQLNFTTECMRIVLLKSLLVISDDQLISAAVW